MMDPEREPTSPKPAVASAVSLTAGTEGFLAGVLGIIGGVVALVWKPQA